MKINTEQLARDEAGTLARKRDKLAAEIDDAWTGLQRSWEQLRRKWYVEIGRKLIELRDTFPKGKIGTNEFGVFCQEHWPAIGANSRSEYITYAKKHGLLRSFATEDHLPPLRKVTSPRRYKKDRNRSRPGVEYRKIVDEEVKQPQQFEIPRSKTDIENELIEELAQKIISAGFRILSLKMHPDKDGGSNEAQRRLNAAKKMLEKGLQRQSLFN